MPILHFSPILLVLAAVLIAWKYFRQLIVSSPLDNITGPPSGSLVYGAYQQCSLLTPMNTARSRTGMW